MFINQEAHLSRIEASISIVDESCLRVLGHNFWDSVDVGGTELHKGAEASLIWVTLIAEHGAGHWDHLVVLGTKLGQDPDELDCGAVAERSGEEGVLLKKLRV